MAMGTSENEIIEDKREVLKYYYDKGKRGKEGVKRNPQHDPRTIRFLKNILCLKCGLTGELEETIQITEYGIKCLKWI